MNKRQAKKRNKFEEEVYGYGCKTYKQRKNLDREYTLFCNMLKYKSNIQDKIIFSRISRR